MSHTSGPWKIFEGWGADKRRPVIVDSIPDVDGKFVGNCICYMASTNPDMEENAKLIAAVPDLLQALQVVAGFYNDEKTIVEQAMALYDARCVALTAIQKATE
jgi:hypothetical protein